MLGNYATGPGGQHSLNQLYQQAPASAENSPDPNALTNWLAQQHYAQWTSYEPASRFWHFQLIEGGRLLALPPSSSRPPSGCRHRVRRTPGSLCTRVTGIRTGMVGNMALAQRTVLILAADDFEDMELLYPLYRLAEEDVEVTVAGLDDHPVRGKKGHGPVPVDTTVEQVAEGDFDALVIPGGFAPDKLRRSATVLDLVRAFDGAGKPIAFICHAGWVPISARILMGRRATSVGAIRDDMVNAGADWVDEATVVDGNLISARTPADLGPWMKALLKALAVG